MPPRAHGIAGCGSGKDPDDLMREEHVSDGFIIAADGEGAEGTLNHDPLSTPPHANESYEATDSTVGRAARATSRGMSCMASAAAKLMNPATRNALL